MSTDPDQRPGDRAREDTASAGEDICPDCGGSGLVDGNDCPACRGTGRIIEAVGGG